MAEIFPFFDKADQNSIFYRVPTPPNAIIIAKDSATQALQFKSEDSRGTPWDRKWWRNYEKNRQNRKFSGKKMTSRFFKSFFLDLRGMFYKLLEDFYW